VLCHHLSAFNDLYYSVDPSSVMMNKGFGKALLALISVHIILYLTFIFVCALYFFDGIVCCEGTVVHPFHDVHTPYFVFVIMTFVLSTPPLLVDARCVLFSCFFQYTYRNRSTRSRMHWARIIRKNFSIIKLFVLKKYL
jgi:hypothetical protein